MTTTIYVTLDELKRMVEFAEKFQSDDEDSKYTNPFAITAERGSGIGSILRIRATATINGFTGDFEHEISGVESW